MPRVPRVIRSRGKWHVSLRGLRVDATSAFADSGHRVGLHCTRSHGREENGHFSSSPIDTATYTHHSTART
eukprot:COSAG05_NODE_2042_length_3648_cov_3.148774_2_plen_71_part_00